MAIINSSSPWFGASGSVGGVTFRSGSGQTTVSIKKSKLKSTSTAQQRTLTLYVTLAQMYKNLSSLDKSAWESIAASNSHIAPNGSSKSIQSINWFTSSNMLQLMRSGSIQSTPDPVAYAPNFSGLNASNASIILQPNFTLYSPSSPTTTLIYATDVVRVGVAQPLSAYRLIAAFSMDGLTGKDVTAQWSAYYNKVYSSVVNYSTTTVKLGLLTMYNNSTYSNQWQLITAQ